MDFALYNYRYGYAHSFTGVIGEVISIINVTDYFVDHTLLIAYSKEDQSTKTVDFSLVSDAGSVITFQTKTVCQKNNVIPFNKEWNTIKSDYTVLVDIDCYDCWLLDTKVLQMLGINENMISWDNLTSSAIKLFNNTNLYGTNEDKQIYNKIKRV
jgi:hypothetical protein